ncbi:hypothetical protein [Rickettsia endosymbiont of Halotydeus destructor]|uniref:hypothetical protein n=1 Tax=Rickettsia endosymbiont of Halotydeus destructor TaxID=2996754 RepID=UPI003BAF557E
MAQSLKEQADKNKEVLLVQTQEYLKNPDNVKPLETNREKIKEAIEKGNFSEALQGLEILREEKTGITLTKIEGKDGSTPILIRDGRNNPNESRVLGTEAFEMQYLNAIRGAIDIAEGENKPELVSQLNKEAVKFINSFNALNMKESQASISKNMQDEIDGVAKLLSENGIKDAHKKLNVAKDFQNFNDEHCNIVTLSKVTDKQGKNHTVIEAEVALKGLTEEQKQEYQNRADKKWFTKMPVWERKLVNKYAETINAGNHVIPTQLRQIVGMKNAFEKITAIADEDGKNFEPLLTSKHAGTLASLSYDEDSRQEIANQNARQAKEFIGNKRLHANTLNSGPVGWGDDPEIVKQTQQAMAQTESKITNTAFNSFRLSSYANDFSGVKSTLSTIASTLEGQEFDDIKTHLKPQGTLSKILGLNKPKGNAKELVTKLWNSQKIDEKTAKILLEAVNLKNDVEKADVPVRIFGDKENINLKISTALNALTEKITNIKDGPLSKIPKEEILTMCASGKDRTALKTHNQTAQAITKRLNIPIDEVDKHVLNNGHAAEQAGSIYAGGATIGCYGTKGENKAGIPKSRKELLTLIKEITAKTNKIRDKKGVDKKHDKEYEKNHPQESVTTPIKNIAVQKKKIIQSSPPPFKPSISPVSAVKNTKERQIR